MRRNPSTSAHAVAIVGISRIDFGHRRPDCYESALHTSLGDRSLCAFLCGSAIRSHIEGLRGGGRGLKLVGSGLSKYARSALFSRYAGAEKGRHARRHVLSTRICCGALLPWPFCSVARVLMHKSREVQRTSRGL
jgi:hypothetical protein